MNMIFVIFVFSCKLYLCNDNDKKSQFRYKKCPNYCKITVILNMLEPPYTLSSKSFFYSWKKQVIYIV